MRVLIVNVNAQSGSTGRITNGLYHYLSSKGVETKVCYRGVLEKDDLCSDFVKLVSSLEFRLSVFLARLTGLESHFSYFATKKLIRLVNSFQPDIVQLYNLHGNYIRSYHFLKYLKRMRIPVVYSMLDEFPYMGKCAYPLDCEKFKTECFDCPQKDKYPESWVLDQSRRLFHLKEDCYNNFVRIIFTGPPYVCQRAKQSYLLSDKHIEELFEPFNFEEYYYPRDTTSLRKKLGIKAGERVAVCASGTYFRKGGNFFIEAAKRLQNVKDLKLVFVGYNEKVGWDIPNNVIVTPRIYDQNVFAEYMSLGDVYVCTSIGDTTPSVCLCALGCGTPIVGFDYGGVRDCAPDRFGTYVPIKDIDALSETIKGCHQKTEEEAKAIRNYAMNRFSQESVYSKQLDLYKKMLNK